MFSIVHINVWFQLHLQTENEVNSVNSERTQFYIWLVNIGQHN